MNEKVDSKKKFKFVIVSPRGKAGGIIALHALCKYLHEIGYDASMFYLRYLTKPGSVFFWYKWFMFTLKDLWLSFTFPIFSEYFPKKYRDFIDFPLNGLPRKILPFVDEDTIVVYPEIIKGRVFNTDKVVRWLLYYNTYQDEDINKEKDLFIAYRLEFNDWELNPNGKVVCCSYFDLNLYKQTNFGQRSGTCFILHKGKNRPDLPENFDGIIVDSLTEKAKVKVFNQCERCISYDTQTAYSHIAALCGCFSIVIPEQGKSCSDYRNDDDKRYGVAIGFSEEQKQYAINTWKDLKTSLEENEAYSKQNIKRFVKYCKEKF